MLVIEKKILNSDGLLIIEHSKKTDLQNIKNYIGLAHSKNHLNEISWALAHP